MLVSLKTKRVNCLWLSPEESEPVPGGTWAPVPCRSARRWGSWHALGKANNKLDASFLLTFFLCLRTLTGVWASSSGARFWWGGCFLSAGYQAVSHITEFLCSAVTLKFSLNLFLFGCIQSLSALHFGNLGLDFCVAWDWRNIWFLFCLLGYCGADIKSLCTEAALCALRRRYPQIYKSREKLLLDIDSIKITAQDFVMAMQKTVPASQRAVASPGRALSPISKPLLENTLARILQALQRVFPQAELALKNDQQQGTIIASTSLKFCQSKNFWFVQLTQCFWTVMTIEFYNMHVHTFISGIWCIDFILDSKLLDGSCEWLARCSRELCVLY